MSMKRKPEEAAAIRQNKRCVFTQNRTVKMTYIRAEFESKLTARMRTLYEREELCDLELWCKDKIARVRTHSIIVYAQIPSLFPKKNENDPKPSNLNREVVVQLDGANLKKIIDYCYTGRIHLTTDKDLKDVCLFANKFCIHDLAAECLNKLYSIINIENCLNIMKLLKESNFIEKIEGCLKFIIDNFIAIGHTAEFSQMSADDFVDVLKSNSLVVASETHIFEIFLKWFYELPTFSFESTVRTTLAFPIDDERGIAKVLPHIRFPLIERNIFSEYAESICKHHKLDYLCAEYYKWHLLTMCGTSEELSENQRLHRNQCLQKMENVRMKPRQMKIERLLAFGSHLKDHCLTIEVLNSKRDKWTNLKKIGSSEAVTRASCAYVFTDDEEVILIGGVHKTSIKRVDRLNLRSMKFESLPCLRQSRCDFGAAIENGIIYAAGGRVYTRELTSVERFDLETQEWSFVKPMAQKRSYFPLIAANRFMYAIGGKADNKSLNSVEYYDTLANVWIQTTPMIEKRIAPAAVVFEDYIYVIGGSQESNVPGRFIASKTVERYHTVNKTWTMIASLNVARDNISACIFQNNIFAIGGYNTESSPQSTVEIYDKEQNKWHRVDDLKTPRGGVMAMVVSYYIDKYRTTNSTN